MTASHYLTPRALLRGDSARAALERRLAWPLLGGWGAFAAAEVRSGEGSAAPLTLSRAVYDEGQSDPAIDHLLAALAAPRAALAGISLDRARPALMGVVNVTPDSFSDGGRFADADAAIAHGVSLAEAGAAIVDVGGESTRPGAAPLATDEEARRVLPVVRALAERGIVVSIDTRHATVMAAAVAAGAAIINDVNALAGEGSLAAAARAEVPVILMHMQGDPATMQRAPHYVWAPGDVCDQLADRIAACQAAGIPRHRIAVDPGIGFGKTHEHSAALIDHLALFHTLGVALCFGASRKSFIGRLSQGEDAGHRLPGSLAAALAAAARGAQIIRAHDVVETRQALDVAARLGG